MHKSHHIILGISPSTRLIGIVLYANGHLIDWRIRTFKGAWSDDKLKSILFWLKNYIKQNKVTCIAMKEPNSESYSTGMVNLITELRAIAHRNRLKLNSHTLNEMKRFYSSEPMNKSQLIRLAASSNTELHHEYNKEQRNRNPYYEKIFEALVPALIVRSQIAH